MSVLLFAQAPMRIEIKLSNFEKDTLFLGSLVGKRHYLLDTAVLDKMTRTFVFEHPTERPEGAYIVITKLGESAFQILLQPRKQQFSIDADANQVYTTAIVQGSVDNDAYLHYLSFSEPLFASLDTLYIKQIKHSEAALEVEQTEKKLAKNIQVAKTILPPSSLFTKLVQLDAQRLELGTVRSNQDAVWFFSQVPMSDERFANSSQLEAIVDRFMSFLVPQQSDTALAAMDWILAQTKPSPENYKHYIRYFLNTYSRPELANLDALYVRISQNYLAKGEAPFLDTSAISRIGRRAATVEPLTVGKIIPNIRLTRRDSSKLALHDINARYTLVFLWDPDCGHCKRVSPKVVELYNELHTEGLEVYAICCKNGSQTPKCWEYIDQTPEIAPWLHVNDPNDSNRFRSIFDVRTTPMCYMIDSQKRIVYKVIGENLDPDIVRSIVRKK